MFGGNNGGFGLDIGALLGNMLAKNGNGDGFGGGWGAWWVIIILFALFGWGNEGNGLFGGRGNNGGGSGVGYTVPFGASFTDAAVQRGFDNQGVMNKLNGIENGLCSLGYQQLAQINGINTNVAAGFAGVNNAVCNLGYQNAQLINGLENTVQNGFNASNVVALQNQNALQTQIANCCCENKQGQAQIQYQMATDTCAITTAIGQAVRDIVDNQNAGFRQVHDEQVALQLQGKDAQIANLTRALDKCDSRNIANEAVQSAVGQINPTARPAYIVPNPNWPPFGYQGYGYGYGNCCGANAFGCC